VTERGRGRRRLQLAAFAIGAAAIVGFGLLLLSRASSASRLERVLEDHRARGIGTSFDDLARSLPDVDAALQERIWAWLKQGEGEDSAGGNEAWYLEGKAQPPENVRRWHDDFRPQAEAFVALLSDDRAVVTSAGWLPADRAKSAGIPVFERQARVPNFARIFAVVGWLETAALREPDLETHLDSLDRMRLSVRPVASILDAMVGAWVDRKRDRAYACLALRGSLSPERLKRWSEEQPDPEARIADGLRAERLTHWVDVARGLLDGRSASEVVAGGRVRPDPADLWEKRIRPWYAAESDCADFLELHAAAEGYFRGTVGAKEVREKTERAEGVGWPFDLARPSVAPFATSAVGLRAAHRMARVVARIAADAGSGHPLPEAHEEAAEWLGESAGLLGAGKWDVALRYTRTARDRFRVEIDPATPVPDLVDRQQLLPGRDFASAAPIVWLEHGIEVGIPTR
jgi:hypothetical protein